MTEASDLFWKAHGHGIIMLGDKESLELLIQAAEKWRKAGKYLLAGIAMMKGIHAAWGDGRRADACAEAALRDYEQCLQTQPPCSLESLLALYKSHQELSRHTRVGDALWPELGNRLLSCYSDSPHADSFLVRGFVLSGNLDDEWAPSFPDGEVIPGHETWGVGQININFPSALYVLVHIPDYQGASVIVERCPDAFTTPGLRGWKAAIRGFVGPDEAPEQFAEAAQAFAEDVYDPERKPTWSSINVDLWAKYFRARAALARIVEEPTRTSELLRAAIAALEGTESGWVNRNISRFRILVKTLSGLTAAGPGLEPEEAREQFLREAGFLGPQEEDEVSLRFLNLVCESFQGFRNNPAVELTTGRLRDAIQTLGRISLFGPQISTAISPAIGEQARRELLGPDRAFVYRTLERIKGEAILRKMLLRLLQASPSPPSYGHIRHGPLEHGKDVVVLLEEGGRSVLKMYQAKCGTITLPVWRTARAELEEIFDVDLPEFQLHGNADDREGILICNGHANPHAEPAIKGWFERQLRDHGRKYQFMHLDDVVNWIHHQTLYGVFRSACDELGLSTSPNAGPRKRRVNPPTKKPGTKRKKPVNTHRKQRSSKPRKKKGR